MTNPNRALLHKPSGKQGAEATEPASGRPSAALTLTRRQQIAGLQLAE